MWSRPVRACKVVVATTQNPPDSITSVERALDELPDDIAALKAALLAERGARQKAEAQASASQALIAHLKLLIAKLRRERYGQSAERGRKLLDQLELQLEELEADATESALAAEAVADAAVVQSFTRRRPVRAPLPAHLPRERVVIPAPCACPACGGRLAKLGEVAMMPQRGITLSSRRRWRWCRGSGR